MGVPLYPISQTAGAYKIPKSGADGKIAVGFIPNLSATYAALAHAHSADEITSGVLANARVNWDSPSAIGGTAAAAGAFTVLSGTVTDALNNVADVLDVIHASSVTPAANFGVGIRFRGHSANNTLRDMGRLRHRWTVATDGSQSSEAIWSLINGGTERDQIAINPSQTTFYINGASVGRFTAAGLDVTAGTYTAIYLKGNILAQALNGDSTALGLGGGFTTTSINNTFQISPSGNATGNALRSAARVITVAGSNTPAIGFGGEITFNLPTYNGSYYDNSKGASQLVWKYYSGDPTLATGLVSMQLRPKRGVVGLAVNEQNDTTSWVGINTEAPTSALDVVGDIETGSANAFYFGDPSTDGSWRLVRSGNDLVIERRVTGAWATKSTIAA